MKHKITNYNHETKNTLTPAAESLYRDLIMTVTVQKDENNRQLAHLT